MSYYDAHPEHRNIRLSLAPQLDPWRARFLAVFDAIRQQTMERESLHLAWYAYTKTDEYKDASPLQRLNSYHYWVALVDVLNLDGLFAD